MKITLLFLGTTGAGPAYSLEMAKALYASQKCDLQVIISKSISNLEQWDSFSSKAVNLSYHKIDTYKRSKLGVLWGFLRIDRMNHVVSLINEFKSDVLYAPFRVVWAPYIYKKLKDKVRIITTLHDPHPHDNAKGLISNLSRKSFDNSLELTNDIVLLNNKDSEYVTNRYHKPVCIIPHASFSYYSKPSANYSDTSLKKRIGFFGRIEPYKGLDVLLDVFSKCKTENLELLIAGSGEIPAKEKNIIDKSSGITLINRYINDDEFDSLLADIDLLVLPYKSATQSGVIPLAFAFGKTVVATNVGALSEQIPNGTGILVDNNVKAIISAIDNLYENPDMIKTMGRNAKEYAYKELTWEKSADKLLKYITDGYK